MIITKEIVADKIAAYLHHEISMTQLVDWAEQVLMDGEFSETDMDILRNVVARLGVADVRTFGLSWEDFEQLLLQLGYSARIDVVSV